MDQKLSDLLELLIEPVWNRNVCGAATAGNPADLLIEPVWNRNTE